MTATRAQTVPDNINDFINGLGVNVHVAVTDSAYYPYQLDVTTGNYTFSQAKLNQLESALQYVGIYNLRDSLSSNPLIDNAFPNPDGSLGQSLWQKLNADIGAKFDFLTIGETPQGTFGSFADVVRHIGVMKFLEGPNEVDDGNWFVYINSSGNRTYGIPAAETIQPYIYNSMKSNPLTAGIPVIQYSIGNIADFPTAGSVTGNYADYGNAHIYFGTGNPPGSGNVQSIMNDGIGMTPNKPVVVTEEGYPTMLNDPQQSVSEAVQAKYILTLLLDTWKQGARNILIYELADYWPDPTGTASREYHFGMYRNDWTPKAAAIALHNFTTILKDSTATNTSKPASLTYTLTGAPASVNSQLFQKQDGTFILTIWNDVRLSGPVSETDITVNSVPVVLTLDQAAAQIQTFDPLVGTAATASQGNVKTVILKVPDHPLIVMITPVSAPAADVPVVTAPTTLSVTAGSTTTIANTAIVDPWAATQTGQMTLNLTTDKGLIRTNSAQAGVTSLQIKGSLADLNAALAGLQFIAPATGGTAHLGINPLNQAGNSIQSNIVVTITGIAVDTPSVTAPGAMSVAAGSITPIENAMIVDAWAATKGAGMIMNLTTDIGLIRIDTTSTGVKSLQINGSLADLNTALADLEYIAPATGGTAHLGINPWNQAGQSLQQYIIMTVEAATPPSTPAILTPAIDAPTISLPATLRVAHGMTTHIADIAISDPYGQAARGQMTLHLTTDTGLIRVNPTAAGVKSLEVTGSLTTLTAALFSLQYIAPNGGGIAHLGVSSTNQAGRSTQKYILITTMP